MRCPLCQQLLGSEIMRSEREFYAHINSPRECSDKMPVCPVCDMSFASYVGSRPWRRFARHWMQYGHLPPEEHAIIARMSEEPSLEDIVKGYGDYGDILP